MIKAPFFLVTGFLGSGKTTFLKNFINRFSKSHRIGIIQNEFAPGKVDGIELKSTGKSFEILEVNNGSVFCVCLLSSFVKSLGDFIETHKPDIVLLEASGLSDPVSIGEMLQGRELINKIFLAHIWCIVDASNFEKLGKTLPRIQHQVRVADTVVINKSDKRNINLEEINRWIKHLNPYAAIKETSFCNIELDLDLFGVSVDPVVIRRQEEHASLERSVRPETGTHVIKTTKTISLNSLEGFLNEVAPGAFRIKGFVRLDNNKMIAVQSCFGETKMEFLSDYSGPTELIGVGPDIDHLTFGSKFRDYQHSGR